MEKQIDAAVKRGRGYWFVDGFTEMLTGGLFVILGAILLIAMPALRASFLPNLLSVAGIVAAVKLVALVAALPLLWWLKDRFTYPRTGYVRGSRESIWRMLAFFRDAVLVLLVPVIAILIAILLVPGMRGWIFTMPAWFPIVVGTLLSMFFGILSWWVGLLRFHIVADFIFLAGVFVAVWQYAAGLPAMPAGFLQWDFLLTPPDAFLVPLEEVILRLISAVGTVTLASGVPILASGFVTFLRYRRANPPAQEDRP